MAKRKRRVFELRWARWSKHSTLEWCLFEQGKSLPIMACRQKRRAVHFAAGKAREAAPSELVIKTKSGRIGKGSSGRRTFGRDPRRTKG